MMVHSGPDAKKIVQKYQIHESIKKKLILVITTISIFR